MDLKIKCLQLDLARQKETIEYIKSFMDYAKDCGYDSLMIYFETTIRTSETENMPHEKTYSKDEVREMLDYAETVGLEVIPSLQNLSYLTDILADAPFSRFAERPGRYSERSNTGCLAEPDFIALMDRYVAEVVSLFSSPYVNMGFDEQFDFGIDERNRALIASDGGKSRSFLRYLLHTHALLARLGKRMMMWDDWLEYADILNMLPRDIILIHWNYVYFSTLPNGHWTGRVLRDPFAEYDRLGFSYMFAFYAQRASSAHNLESLTAYAEKYAPLGGLTATWDSSDCFYEGAFPVIRLAPALWDGRVKCRADAARVYAEVLDSDEELARLLLLSDVTEVVMNNSPATVNYAPSFPERLYRSHLTLLSELVDRHLSGKTGTAETIVRLISLYLREQCAKMRVNELSDRIFDFYEGAPTDPAKLRAELNGIRKEFAFLQKEAEAYWQVLRPGIQSRGGAFQKKYAYYRSVLDKTERDLPCAPRPVLTVRQAAPELYNTLHVSILAEDENGCEQQIFEGSIKPPEALLETGGSFAARFAVSSRSIRRVTIRAFGEGALYLENVSFRRDGKTTFAQKVVSADDAEHPENAVKPDCSFAKLGCEDGAAHWEDHTLSKKRTSVTLEF